MTWNESLHTCKSLYFNYEQLYYLFLPILAFSGQKLPVNLVLRFLQLLITSVKQDFVKHASIIAWCELEVYKL